MQSNNTEHQAIYNLSVTWRQTDHSRHSFLVVTCWLFDDDETLSFSGFDSDLVQQCDSCGHLAGAQHDRKYLHISVWGDFSGRNSSVSKSNWLHVLMFRFILCYVEVYSIDSFKLIGDSSWILELQPVISQTQQIYL